MKHHDVLRIVGKLLIPFILLFALYVQFHGDFGPGGGFQAGVIFASGFILYAIIFGVTQAQRIVPPILIQSSISLGILLYLLVGLAGLLGGVNFLDYSVLGETSVKGQHLGILIIEFGVGLTVAAVMITVFFAFTSRNN